MENIKNKISKNLCELHSYMYSLVCSTIIDKITMYNDIEEHVSDHIKQITDNYEY